MWWDDPTFSLDRIEKQMDDAIQKLFPDIEATQAAEYIESLPEYSEKDEQEWVEIVERFSDTKISPMMRAQITHMIWKFKQGAKK